MAACFVAGRRTRIADTGLVVHALRCATTRGQYAIVRGATVWPLIESRVPLNRRFCKTLAHLHGGCRRDDRYQYEALRASDPHHRFLLVVAADFSGLPRGSANHVPDESGHAGCNASDAQNCRGCRTCVAACARA
jgi:hypothetical protein